MVTAIKPLYVNVPPDDSRSKNNTCARPLSNIRHLEARKSFSQFRQDCSRFFSKQRHRGKQAKKTCTTDRTAVQHQWSSIVHSVTPSAGHRGPKYCNIFKLWEICTNSAVGENKCTRPSFRESLLVRECRKYYFSGRDGWPAVAMRRYQMYNLTVLL